MVDKHEYILLVEDEPAHAELVLRAFQTRSFPVRLQVANSLAEARACLQAGSPPPNLIIADWRLPDGDSIDFLLAGATQLNVPVVIMTSHGNERVAVEAMRAGALDYVVKTEASLEDMPHIAERALRDWKMMQERAEMENALRERGELLRNVVTNVPMLLFATDRHGTFTLCEGKGLAQVGLEPGQVVGQSIFDVYRDIPDLLSGVLRAQAGEPHVVEINIHNSHFDTWLTPISVNNGAVGGVIGVATDITDRRKAESQLKSVHRDLVEAYDATIEGWAQALELRERETAGHSRRVVMLTLELARRMGVGEENLLHIRYGALLHDIGKMGIPDHILLKPGALTEDEWVIMRQHPTFSYRLLADIQYLRSAMDIPYCHHERWDGSGYPRGLQGEQIPLAARIFAVVDVWDALLSDRSYRPAWTEEAARTYLRDHAGRQFDPRVVELFLQMDIKNGFFFHLD